MPPCIPLKDSDHSKRASSALELGSIRKAIPAQAFEKSILKSSYYMIFDYSLWIASLYIMTQVCQSSKWETLPLWQKTIASIIYWNISGFFMWCLFVVGHDCGHGTFSNYELLNDIIGHIVHGSILVPFYPWQVYFVFHLFLLSKLYFHFFILLVYSYLIDVITCIIITRKKIIHFHGMMKKDFIVKMKS
jgi:fatty acid desaturase